MSRIRRSGVLATVLNRQDVLDCLSDGILEKRRMEDELQVSRQTVSRALSELSDADVVSLAADGTCQFTPFGRFVYREVQQTVQSIDQYQRTKPLLLALPPDTELDRRVVRHADCYVAERPAPHRPLRELWNLFQTRDSVLGTTPVILPTDVDIVVSEIEESMMDVELLFDPTLLDHLQTEFPDALDSALTAPNAAIWCGHTPRNVGVMVFDERIVWTGVYDGTGSLVGALVNDSPQAVDSAMELLRDYRGDAERLADWEGSDHVVGSTS